ncbi:MAG: hypothetical protein GX154_04285 [Clostridiales bacterium]|nr:hypothetical protein [Clostridiales bacterium]
MKLATKLASKKVSKKVIAVFSIAMMMLMMAVPGLCTEPETPSLDINFDIEEMFTWAQTIINAMLPVVYIIMGVALGFLIIRAFKAAFN